MIFGYIAKVIEEDVNLRCEVSILRYDITTRQLNG